MEENNMDKTLASWAFVSLALFVMVIGMGILNYKLIDNYKTLENRCNDHYIRWINESCPAGTFQPGELWAIPSYELNIS